MFSCEYCEIFKNTYFEKTSANGCFCIVSFFIAAQIVAEEIEGCKVQNEIVTNSIYSFNTLNFRMFGIVLKNEMREQADEINLYFIISKINEFKYQLKYNFLCTMNLDVNDNEK